MNNYRNTLLNRFIAQEKTARWAAESFQVTTLEELLDRATENIVYQFQNSICVLMLVEEDTLVIKSTAGLNIDTIKHKRIPIGKSFSGRLAKRGESKLYTDVSKDINAISDNMEPYYCGSLVSIPLIFRRKVIGLLNIYRHPSVEPFSFDDLNIIKSYTSQTAFAIESQRLVDRRTKELKETQEKLVKSRDALWGEMQLAKKIQTVLLPKNPSIPGYKIAVKMIPADSVGGDYYDVINVDGYFWLVIGDVSGHGVLAGLIMMMTQTSIHTVLHQNPGISPKDLLTIINKTITKNLTKLGESNYMTITVIAYMQDDNLIFSGLHLPLLIYRSKTNKVEMIDTQGMWIGILQDVNDMNQVSSFSLNSNDSLLLYTDGIVEAKDKNNQLFSIERLVECFKKNASKSAENIRDSILAELTDLDIDDDVSLLVMKKD